MASQSPGTPPRFQRGRSFLLYAFGISILAHILIGPLIARWKAPDVSQEQIQKVSLIKKVAIVVPTPSPPPQPTPPPTPRPKITQPPPPAPAAKLKVEPPKTHTQTVQGPTEQVAPPAQGNANGAPGGSGSGNGAGGTGIGPGFSTAPPPAPTKPPCANPQVAARTVNAVAPDTPDIARQQGITGNVEVKVDLNEKSQVTGVSIYKTANHLLDKAALDAAKGSRFQTAIENCQPIASSYRFVVEFQSE